MSPVPLPPSDAPPPHAEAAWEWFRSIGSPKFHVAPMVDQSELAFRMLCRKHGATAAYTPMLHARLFLEGEPYRAEQFTTCKEDRPLFAQFCANDPDILLAAAKLVEHRCDAVDINLGCPQRIAKRGRYGAFLMDDLPLVERLVKALAGGLRVPVTVKIRRFDDVARTVAYARMLEAAGASLVAVHGRTREQKQARSVLADWSYIRAVKEALHVPVIANGNIRTLQDCHDCMAATGADGVMSAESLLLDPALFDPRRMQPGGAYCRSEAPALLLEYCDMMDEYPTHQRMVRGHVFCILDTWLSEHTDLRDRCNQRGVELTTSLLREVARELQRRIAASGRTYPIPVISARQRARMEREAAIAAAVDEQSREERLLAALDAKRARLTVAASGAEVAESC